MSSAEIFLCKALRVPTLPCNQLIVVLFTGECKQKDFVWLWKKLLRSMFMRHYDVYINFK